MGEIRVFNMIQPSRLLPVWSLLAVCLAIAGCSNDKSNADAVVQGTVTINGVLANRGQVTFYPAQSGPVATGPIHQDGSFSLRVGQGDMANPDESKISSGEYIATVVVNEPANPTSTVGDGGPPLAGKRLTAIKYSQKETSGLKFSVKPGRNVFTLELEGSQNDPPPALPEHDDETGEVEIEEEPVDEMESEAISQEATAVPTNQEQSTVRDDEGVNQ
jgi:hypothetical protein